MQHALTEEEMQSTVGGVAPVSFGKPLSSTKLARVQGGFVIYTDPPMAAVLSILKRRKP